MDPNTQFPAPTTGRDNGKVYYNFNIKSQPKYGEPLKCSKQQLETSFISACTPAIISTYLLDFYERFLNVHAKRFATTYTPAQLIKATKHFATFDDDSVADDDVEWVVEPTTITVSGVFNLFWHCTAAEEPKIELAFAEEAPQKKQESTALEEASLDDLPQGNSNEFLRLTSDSQLRERRTIEEARIRAKWAQYKAEKAIAKYVEKYGEFDDEFLSDSESDDSSESD